MPALRTPEFVRRYVCTFKSNKTHEVDDVSWQVVSTSNSASPAVSQGFDDDFDIFEVVSVPTTTTKSPKSPIKSGSKSKESQLPKGLYRRRRYPTSFSYHAFASFQNRPADFMEEGDAIAEKSSVRLVRRSVSPDDVPSLESFVSGTSARANNFDPWAR